MFFVLLLSCGYFLLWYKSFIIYICCEYFLPICGFLFYFIDMIFFKLINYLFIYFWLCWVFVSVRGLSLVAASGGHSSSRCVGLSLSWPLLLRSTGSRRAGSVVVAHGPSCSAACGIFPDQGSNPCPLALAGRFSTTVPPGKPWHGFWLAEVLHFFEVLFINFFFYD